MKNKGYAISAIVYPLLLICFVLILSILQNLNNKQTLLDNLKSIIKNENNEMNSVCEYVVGTQWTFDYTGSPEEFTVPCNGTYKLETWGAQGGNATTTYIGGLGGYSYGNAKLDLGNVLYVTVGGQGGNATGNNLTAAGGYNGGGSALTTNYNANYINSGGGGATHIALGTTNRGELYNYENYKSELLIVAGGGGGGSYWDAYYSGKGGTGGGISGSNAVYITGTENTYGTGASQTAGGYCAYNTTYNPGYFGKASTTTYNFNNQSGGGASGAGGGGGYYSGGGGCQAGQGGGGGSGYIGGVTDGTTSNGVRTGNGYAKITLVSIDNSTPVDNEPVVEIEVSLNRADFNITDDIGIVAFGVSKSDTEAPQYTLIESTLSTTQTWNTTEKGTYYVWVKDTGGNITIKAFKILNVCAYEVGQTWTFDYSGNSEEFTIPCSGAYKLEVWGASGGYAYDSSRSTGNGGYGGYSVGTYLANSSSNLYITVGGEGGSNCQTTSCVGGYNGGSNSTKWAGGDGTGLYTGGGGGATHIALGTTNRGELKNYVNNKSEVLIVAGGGGGGDYFPSWAQQATGGSGGGYIGNNAVSSSDLANVANTGGTQTSGYAFGTAGTTMVADSTGGSGGGWYGGISSSQHSSGAGGSGYIGNTSLISFGETKKHMVCYKCNNVSNNIDIMTQTTNNISDSAVSDYAKKGNGYSKITLMSIDKQPTIEVEALTNKANFTINDDIGVIAYGISKSNTEEPEYISIESTTSTIKTWNTKEKGKYYVWVKDTGGNVSIKAFEILNISEYEIGQTWTFDYSGKPEEFIVPCDGTYKLEVWGAKGGNAYTASGGNGGYSTGYTELKKDDVLYIVCGGQGSTTQSTVNGGYNGGGGAITKVSGNYAGSGGGATHIAKVSGTLKSIGKTSFVTNQNGFIVAGGGGGAYYRKDTGALSGGAGGGTTGGSGMPYDGLPITSVSGGTQTSGYAFGEGASYIIGGANSGAGGGLYGGNCDYYCGSGGGSGYIGGVTDGTMQNGVNSGHGYAKITLVSID